MAEAFGINEFYTVQIPVIDSYDYRYCTSYVSVIRGANEDHHRVVGGYLLPDDIPVGLPLVTYRKVARKKYGIELGEMPSPRSYFSGREFVSEFVDANPDEMAHDRALDIEEIHAQKKLYSQALLDRVVPELERKPTLWQRVRRWLGASH